MEKLLKEIVRTDSLENLLKSIQASCTELIKYKPLFSDSGLHEIYEDKVRDLYIFLIRRCKYSLLDYYKEKINNIYSIEAEFLPWADETTAETEETEETVKTVKTVETEETEETEEETDEES